MHMKPTWSCSSALRYNRKLLISRHVQHHFYLSKSWCAANWPLTIDPQGMPLILPAENLAHYDKKCPWCWWHPVAHGSRVLLWHTTTQGKDQRAQNLWSMFRLHKQALLCGWDHGNATFPGKQSSEGFWYPQRRGCVTTAPQNFFSDIPADPAFYLPFSAFLSTKVAFYRSNYNDSKMPFLTGNVEFDLFSLCTLLSTYQTLNFICHYWISGSFCDSHVQIWLCLVILCLPQT